MANRAYLYAIKKEDKKAIGMGECNYAIPFVFKLLVSSNTQIIPSMIFQSNELIALQGDFEKGKQKLYAFLDELLVTPEIQFDELTYKIENTRKFLETIEADYIYLDCAEIYDMTDEPLEKQNKKLVDEINNIDKELANFYKKLMDVVVKYKNLKNSFPNKGLFLNRRRKKVEQELEQVKREIDDMLFLDWWSNILYYNI